LKKNSITADCTVGNDEGVGKHIAYCIIRNFEIFDFRLADCTFCNSIKKILSLWIVQFAEPPLNL